MSETVSQPSRAAAEAARAGELDLTLYGDAHVRRYEVTDGAEGYLWNGAPTLVLTTTGAKSGTPRKHALIYGIDGDDVLVVASKGGAPDHPQWYRNLCANPHVTVQVRDHRSAGVARTATPAEKPRLWPIVVRVWPIYDDNQAKTDRDIPVVVISRR